MGAFSYLQKPATKESLNEALVKIKEYVERPVSKLLLVEDDERSRKSITELIGAGDVATTAVGDGQSALAALERETFDCMVLDLGLPDMTGLDLIEKIRKNERLAQLPIIVYTGRELNKEEETELKRVAETVVIKDAASPERLLDETALFLHRVETNLSEEKRAILIQLHQKDPVLAAKKVLIVDDDVRNIFALTSLLEHQEMLVLYAENGKDALRVLQETPDIDVVLMDIMMPEMDGYETTRAIRFIEKYKSLPIIALTAKAMKGDREKCIEAGASDYIAKPVESERLLSLLRVWLYKGKGLRASPSLVGASR
jgi:CheY-like chemotaxis protein